MTPFPTKRGNEFLQYEPHPLFLMLHELTRETESARRVREIVEGIREFNREGTENV